MSKLKTTLIATGTGIAGLVIGLTAGGGSHPAATPLPAVTVTSSPQPVATVTRTVTPTANAAGQATSISADGVYVVGQDIPGGTWHTSGGQQCYEATLSGLDTVRNIISNDNFTGPDTVSLSGVKAFNISGGCTWRHEN
jgi:hypothetical protein